MKKISKGMKKIVIGVHGLGNKPHQTVLKDWWAQAIQEGLNRIGTGRKDISFELVYWADIMHPIPLDHTITNSADPLYVDEPYVKGPLEIVEKRSYVKTKLFKYIDEKLDTIFLNEDLSIKLKGVTDQIIQKYFFDLKVYCSDDSVSFNDPKYSAKTDIQNRLLQVLKKYDRYDILLIAHSMGSIVAFDVLSEYSDQLNIDTFITIGSPLGLPFIVGRKIAEQKLTNPDITKPKVPNCIWPYWYNLSDLEDKVAMDHTLNDDYAPNKLGTKAVDIAVYNDYEINGKRNAHKAFGYLRTPELARIIDEFLSLKKRERLFRRYKKFTRTVIADSQDLWEKHFKRT
ncbi:MAG: hypothetical protein ABIJ37_01820 [Pseudomonadota bacterium]